MKVIKVIKSSRPTENTVKNIEKVDCSKFQFFCPTQHGK